MRRFWLIVFSILLLPSMSFAQDESHVTLMRPKINLSDNASLQRGAKWYINYCSGCHSLAYLRYNRLAADIGITKADGSIDENLVKNNLIFTDSKITDAIRSALVSSDGKQWFGVAPPDLTLEVAVRGADWVYTYLMSFYRDPKQTWGSNNWVFPGTAMPNILANLQGEQIPVFRNEVQIVNGAKHNTKVIDHLVLVHAGLMSPVQFAATMNDLVNFLTYTSEPMRETRIQIGIWVLLFLVILAVVTYLLKREFWRDVKH